MHDVAVGNEGVARIVDTGAGLTGCSLSAASTGGRSHLAVLIRHVAGLGHQRRDLDRIAENVNVLHLDRFEGEEVDLHHRSFAVMTPAWAAMLPARCGGITFKTSAFTSSAVSNFAVSVRTSTSVRT